MPELTTLNDGRKVVAAAGTGEALTDSVVQCTEVMITAELDNGGVICVGGANVVADAATRTGVPLGAGDSIVLNIDSLGKVYIDATVNGEGVTYAYNN